MIVPICNFFIYIVEAIVLLQYSSSLFYEKEKSMVKKVSLLCLLYLALFAVSLLNISWLNMLLYTMVNFLFLFTQYNIKWHTALFHSAIITAIMCMCELAVYSVIAQFTPRFVLEAKHFFNIIIFAIASKMLFVTIVYLLLHLQKEGHEKEKSTDKSAFLLMITPLTSILVMQTFLVTSDSFIIPSSMEWMIIFCDVLMLVNNILIFGLHQYNQKKNIEFTEMQLLLQKEKDLADYYAMIQSQNENQRILIHDIKKHLQSIRLLNTQNENVKINNYIEQLILSSDLREYSRLCDHEVLNAILCRYMQQCTDRNINFHADIRKGTISFVSDADLTSLFCNLLDNALEATDSIPEAFVEISTVKHPNTPFIVITLINSCRKSPFIHGQDLPITHKTDKFRHGFGLKSIQRIVHKYHGDLQMYYCEENSTFHSIITLKENAAPII